MDWENRFFTAYTIADDSVEHKQKETIKAPNQRVLEEIESKSFDMIPEIYF